MQYNNCPYCGKETLPLIRAEKYAVNIYGRDYLPEQAPSDPEYTTPADTAARRYHHN